MERLKALMRLHPRRTKIILVVSLLLVIAIAVFATDFYLHRPAKKVTKTTPKKVAAPAPVPPAPTTKASLLTGAQVEPALADRPATAVVIENHSLARPQAGLSQAGVVYEALAEGGITRFLAFFQENRPATIGPVRSVRTYFVDWALEFSAPLAHAGGNADALDLIGPLHIRDMNQFQNGKYFYRSGEKKAIEHTLFTSSDSLDNLEKALGYFKPASFTPSPRKPDAAATAAQPAAHPAIHIDYSYNGFQVDYAYEQSSNTYLRSMAGAPHTDRNTGQQIHVKNVVVEYMPTSYGVTRIGESTVIMSTPGSGQAIVFRDGTAITGTWRKTSHTTRTELIDAAGQAIPLDAGNTWYSIVPVGKTVTY
jgi:hypothetical protein